MSMTRDDEGLLAARDRVNMITVRSVQTKDDDLELRLEDEVIWIDGRGDESTTDSRWRICVQAAG